MSTRSLLLKKYYTARTAFNSVSLPLAPTRNIQDEHRVILAQRVFCCLHEILLASFYLTYSAEHLG